MGDGDWKYFGFDESLLKMTLTSLESLSICR